MASHNAAVPDVRKIIETYLKAAIRTIEGRTCDYCHKGKWRVITILADGSDPSKPEFDMVAAVQCRNCQEIDERKWDFNPFEYQHLTGD